jgi:ATP-dependent DNA ligase
LAIGSLPANSCLIDGEAIVTNEAGLADFEPMGRQRTNALAVLVAFDRSSSTARICAAYRSSGANANSRGC